MPMQLIGGSLQFDQSPLGQPIAMPAQPAAKPKGGMFGSGGAKWADAIQAALAGYLASRGNPAGMAGLQMLQQKRQQALEESKYQQHRQDSLSDWIAQQSWKQANPAAPDPTAFQRDYEWFQQNQPGMAEQFARAHAASGGSPFGPMFTDPATGQRYMMGQQQGLPPIGSVTADPRQQGGPMPSASGGFPPSGY